MTNKLNYQYLISLKSIILMRLRTIIQTIKARNNTGKNEIIKISSIFIFLTNLKDFENNSEFN